MKGKESKMRGEELFRAGYIYKEYKDARQVSAHLLLYFSGRFFSTATTHNFY